MYSMTFVIVEESFIGVGLVDVDANPAVVRVRLVLERDEDVRATGAGLQFGGHADQSLGAAFAANRVATSQDAATLSTRRLDSGR